MMSSPREFVVFAQIPLGLVGHRSLPKRLPLTVASAPESDTDDDHPLLPSYKRKRRPNWETIEAEATQARAARVDAEIG